MAESAQIRVLYSGSKISSCLGQVSVFLNNNFGNSFNGRKVVIINTDNNKLLHQWDMIFLRGLPKDSDALVLKCHVSQYVKRKIAVLANAGRNIDITTLKSGDEIRFLPSYYSTDNLKLAIFKPVKVHVKNMGEKKLSVEELCKCYIEGIYLGKFYFTTVSNLKGMSKLYGSLSESGFFKEDDQKMYAEAYYFTADKFTQALMEVCQVCLSLKNNTKKHYFLRALHYSAVLGFKKNSEVQKIIFYNPLLMKMHKTFIITEPSDAQAITIDRLWMRGEGSPFKDDEACMLGSAIYTSSRSECKVSTCGLGLKPYVSSLTLAFGHFGHSNLGLSHIENKEFPALFSNHAFARACQQGYTEAVKTFIEIVFNTKFSDNDETSNKIMLDILHVRWQLKKLRNTTSEPLFPLLLACWFNRLEIVEFFVTNILNSDLSNYDKVRMLLPFSEYNMLCRPCLKITCRYENFEVVAKFLKIVFVSDLPLNYQMLLLKSIRHSTVMDSKSRLDLYQAKAKAKVKTGDKAALLSTEDSENSHLGWVSLSTDTRRQKISKYAQASRLGGFFYSTNHKLRVALEKELLDI